MSTTQHTPKPHIVMRGGRACLFANRKDASYWPFPVLDARTVRALSEAVAKTAGGAA